MFFKRRKRPEPRDGYQGNLGHRDIANEPELRETDLNVFEAENATSINKARLAHLESIGLPIEGKRVIDVGCGVGHFSRFYTGNGCQYFGVDGRASNIDAMRKLYPQLQGAVADVQVDSLRKFGSFDIVHCYGLLYHLESPVAGLRNMRSTGAQLIVLETIICDATEPMLLLDDEAKIANQALHGLACRPSPSYVAMALNRIGYRFVYLSSSPPDHEDFKFDWLNDRTAARDGHNLRCVFVASDFQVSSPLLERLV